LARWLNARLTDAVRFVRVVWMKNSYLLICVEKAEFHQNPLNDEQSAEWPRWIQFLEELEKISPPFSENQRPTESTFLLPLNLLVSVGSKLLDLLGHSRIPYKVFYLEDEPRECS